MADTQVRGMNKRNAAADDDNDNDNEIFMITVGNWVTGAARRGIKTENVQRIRCKNNLQLVLQVRSCNTENIANIYVCICQQTVRLY